MSTSSSLRNHDYGGRDSGRLEVLAGDVPLRGSLPGQCPYPLPRIRHPETDTTPDSLLLDSPVLYEFWESFHPTSVESGIHRPRSRRSTVPLVPRSGPDTRDPRQSDFPTT